MTNYVKKGVLSAGLIGLFGYPTACNPFPEQRSITSMMPSACASEQAFIEQRIQGSMQKYKETQGYVEVLGITEQNACNHVSVLIKHASSWYSLNKQISEVAYDALEEQPLRSAIPKNCSNKNAELIEDKIRNSLEALHERYALVYTISEPENNCNTVLVGIAYGPSRFSEDNRLIDYVFVRTGNELDYCEESDTQCIEDGKTLKQKGGEILDTIGGWLRRQ